jgi:pimeloyl-ACP methyl ester carboxylesterase
MPLHWSAVEEVMGVPGWKSLPSWFMIADGDQVISPDAQRQFAARMGVTTVKVSANHVAMGSHPDDVLQLIGTAVEAVS